MPLKRSGHTPLPRSVQRTERQQKLGLLPSSLPRSIVLVESLSQVLGSRGKVHQGPQTPVRVSQKFKANRLPLIGLRSQARIDYTGRLKTRGELYPGRNALFSNLRETPGTRSICEQRAQRREHLFRVGIAGPNRRRSPGRGGHYRRTQDSYYSCKTYRK